MSRITCSNRRINFITHTYFALFLKSFTEFYLMIYTKHTFQSNINLITCMNKHIHKLMLTQKYIHAISFPFFYIIFLHIELHEIMKCTLNIIEPFAEWAPCGPGAFFKLAVRAFKVTWVFPHPLSFRQKIREINYRQISNIRHICGQLNYWSLSCSWSIPCRRCSNYIFILNLTHGFSRLGRDNCKTRRETF